MPIMIENGKSVNYNKNEKGNSRKMFEIHVNKFGDFTGNETVRREGNSDHGTREESSCCNCFKRNCFSCCADKNELLV